MNGMTELQALLLLLLVGFLPNEVWRMLGLMVARRVEEESELFLWARAVATAVLAGVIAKLVVFPPGALATVAPAVRFAAIACGLSAFFLLRRSVFAGVLAGEIVLVAGASVTAL